MKPHFTSRTRMALFAGQWAVAVLATPVLMIPEAAAQAVLPPQPVADPLPAIQPSGITVNLVPFTTVPHGSPQLIQPVGDGSGRLAINETGGRIYMTTPAGGALGTPYLDLNSPTYASWFIGGLMGLAFAPDFATTGKFYTSSYASSGSGITPLASSSGTANDMLVTEWTASEPNAATFSGTRREVLRVAEPRWGHAIGMVAFNPNAAPGTADYGKLYVSMGDSGDNQSYLETGQDKSVPYGKVLRIDPTPSVTAGYTVPSDNPFVNEDGVEKTIWAYGLRNPQYLSWMRGGAGTMYINDIGEGNIEEVNTGIAGGNYGWSTREGTFATVRDPALGIAYGDPGTVDVYRLTGNPEPGLLYPIAQYDHDEGRAIGAGLLYQGSIIPQLTGKYVATDIVNGRLFVADVGNRVSTDDPTQAIGFASLDTLVDGTPQSLLDAVSAFGANRVDARLGTDGLGNLYVVSKARGDIYRVEAVSQPVPAPGGVAVFAVGLAALMFRGRIRLAAIMQRRKTAAL